MFPQSGQTFPRENSRIIESLSFATYIWQNRNLKKSKMLQKIKKTVSSVGTDE